LAAQNDVVRLVSEWTGARTRDRVMELCLAGEVPAGPLNTIEDIFADPHFKARNDLETIDDPALGPIVIPGVVPRLSETPGRITNLGPPLGNANTEIYGGLLGLSEDELERLRRAGVI
jgi:succinyl-CoA:(S)-malate CoA-transferase subunit A